MTAIAASNRLAVLAADIRAAHGTIRAGALTMAETAIAAGNALIEAKAGLPHGAWMDWLHVNTGLSGRTARRYMQLAESGLEVATVANLGLRGALEKTASRRGKISVDSDPEYLRWAAEVFGLLHQIETASPNFTAAFLVWAAEQEPITRQTEILLTSCKTEQARAQLLLNTKIQQDNAFADLLKLAQPARCA